MRGEDAPVSREMPSLWKKASAARDDGGEEGAHDDAKLNSKLSGSHNYAARPPSCVSSPHETVFFFLSFFFVSIYAFIFAYVTTRVLAVSCAVPSAPGQEGAKKG